MRRKIPEITEIIPELAGKNLRNCGEKSPKSRGKIPEIAGGNPRNREENSPKSRGFFTEIAGIFHGDRGDKSDAFAGRSNRSLGSPNLRIKKTFIE